MASYRRTVLVGLLLTIGLIATVALHLVYVPRHFPDDTYRAVPYLLAAWATFALVFYAVGRLASDPAELPSMRSADAGVTLVLLSLLIAGGLDALGFTPALVVEAYVLPAVGLYVGLALVGWSLGQRTKAINRIAGLDRDRDRT